MSFTGLMAAGAQLLGTQALLVRPQRGLKTPTFTDNTGTTYVLPDIAAQGTLEERITDELEVTDHPVEIGAEISDHAFKLPTQVVLHLAWSNSPSSNGSLLGAAAGAAAAISPVARALIGGVEFLGAAASVLTGGSTDQMAAIYDSLVTLQVTRSLFDVYTGKRILRSMVCRTISVNNDWKTENALFVTMVCKQVILVNTQNVTLPSAVQAKPLETASPVNNGVKSAMPVIQQAAGTFAR